MGGLPLLDRVALGDHVCWAVDDDAVRMEAIAGFVRAGLQARHQVHYCGDDPASVLAGLTRHGIGTGPATAAGQLIVQSAESSYLACGHFDPEATIALWHRQIADALAAGYLGIRVVGDMTWATRGIPGRDRLPWYEAQVNTVFLGGYVAGVCAYDRRVFDPLELRRLSWAHHGAASTGSAYDPGTSLRIARTRNPRGVRLSGEVDLSNRIALTTLVEHLFDDGGPEVTVDLTDLTFADTASVRILVAAADSGAGRIRLVGCSPAVLRLLDFHHAGEVPDLIVEAL